MLTFLRRIIRFGWLNFWREGGLSVATVFVLTVTISLISFLFVSQGAVKHLIGQIQDKIDISIYIEPDVSQEEIFEAQERLGQLPEIKSVTYSSPDEVLEEFRKRHSGDPTILESLEAVGSNPFYASLNIRAKSPDQYAAILSALDNPFFGSIVKEVDYFQKKTVIDKLSDFIANINTIGFFLAVALGVVAVLVAFNTIRVAIYDSSKEISIMRMVGAPNRFIRGPFIVQGVLAGIIAAFISCLILFLSTYFTAPRIEVLTNGFNIFSWWTSRFGVVMLIQLFSGIGLSVLCSLIAIRRYLTA